VKNFLIPVLVIQIGFASLGFAQSPNALNARKVQDYFQDVESKSYYQQERIRSMKGEMNEYSERLHTLQEKFQKIFYGRSTDELHQSPFSDKEKISYPKRKYRDPIPLEDVESIVRRPTNRAEMNPPSNQLAFTVQDSTPSVPQKDPVEDFAPTQSTDLYEPMESSANRSNEAKNIQFSSSASSFGGYLILRPGVAIPYKDKTTHNGPGKTKHREYKTGMSISLAGGYRWKGWKFGGGILYRENEHDSGSYESSGGNTEPFAGGSQSTSVAAFLETGYTHSFNPLFGVYGTISLGYGVSRIEDFAPTLQPGEDRSRIDPFFFASGGFGLSWTPSQHFAASLGYRYLHDSEVPAHAIQLGLEGKF